MAVDDDEMLSDVLYFFEKLLTLGLNIVLDSNQWCPFRGEPVFLFFFINIQDRLAVEFRPLWTFCSFVLTSIT